MICGPRSAGDRAELSSGYPETRRAPVPRTLSHRYGTGTYYLLLTTRTYPLASYLLTYDSDRLLTYLKYLPVEY